MMAVAMALMVVEGSTLGFLSYMLKPLFDQVFVGNQTEAVGWVGGIILALFIVRAISLMISRTLLTRIAMQSSTEMQVDLVRHLLTLDNRFFQQNPPGSLIERVQGDTVAVQAVWRTVVTGASRDLVSLGSLLVVAILVDPVWTLVALVGVPLLILPVAVVQRYIRRKTAAMREEAASRATRLDEIFHGITAVKLNGMEDYQAGRFQRIVNQIVRAEIKITASSTSVPAMIDIVSGLGFFLVVLVGARDIASGDRTVGEFMAFFTAMALCFQPLRRLGMITGAWQTAAASLERLYRLFDTVAQITAPARPRPAPAGGAPEITLEDVQFSYGDLEVLRGVSFRALAGKTTALVGPSGAGKSTIFNLLTRLEDPRSGHLRIGGTDVADMDFTALRGMFSVVTQDAALFDETLRENILLGRGDIEDARLARILDAAHVAPFVRAMPQGLETPAGPRGSGLSGGQRQRIAIARALVRDTPILLLDEATSALDTQSERMVQDALERLSQGRTTLVIAHRLSTVRNADNIIVLDHGRVAAQGTHESLLAEDGLYAQLCRLQFDEGRAA
jgi:ATP-binding cassette subfamily B protein/subfamily B ATP-binding cassette protein MsbA